MWTRSCACKPWHAIATGLAWTRCGKVGRGELVCADAPPAGEPRCRSCVRLDDEAAARLRRYVPLPLPLPSVAQVRAMIARAQQGRAG